MTWGWELVPLLLVVAPHMRVLSLIFLGFLVGCLDSSDGDHALDSELYVQFTQARDSVMVGDPWSEATLRIEERLGPARIQTDTERRWATVEGDECFDLRLVRTGVLDELQRITNTYVTTADAEAFERCRAIAQPIGA